MPVQQQQRPTNNQNQQARQQRPCQSRPRCGFAGFARKFMNGGGCRRMQTSNTNTNNSQLDKKTKWATFRVGKLTGTLGCCNCLFSCFGLGFFISAIVTLCSARFNAAHIAQTGHLPWVAPQPEFVVSETPAKYEFGLYDIFLKMGFLQMLLAMTMSAFAMRTMIAAACKAQKNSNIAFRRTFYCIFAFLLFYGLLFREQGKLQEVYPQIADEMNVTAPFQQEPWDFGGRYLQQQQFDLPEFLSKLKNKFEQQAEKAQHKETQEAAPQEIEQPEIQPEAEQEVPQKKHHRRHGRHGKHGKHHRQQPAEEGEEGFDYSQPCHGQKPLWEQFQDEAYNQSRYEQVGGMCPVCFIFILFCAICQLCVLKKHARACKALKDLRDWQQAEAAANQADLEAQQEYQAVINSSVVEEDKSGDFDYSFDEPANPEDKSGSGHVFTINVNNKMV